jgi:glycosyltransferase involved in cell wall biosynthesis
VKILVNATTVASEKFTGIERYSLRISQELSRIDSSVEIVGTEEMSDIPSVTKSPLLKMSRRLLGGKEYLFRAVWDQTFFRRYVTKVKPDLVYFTIQDGFFFPPVKQIITVYDLHYLHFDKTMPECRKEIDPFRTKLYKYKLPHMLKHSVAVVAISEATKNDIVKSFDIDPDKIIVNYCGYDDLRFRVVPESQPILERYDLKAGEYFLFVGSILKHKNIARLVQAFARLGCSAKLVITGVCKDRVYLEELKKIATDLRVGANRICYLDYVSDDDLPYLYNGAISFLLPSLHEGFGIPIIEAMACGTPVITSDCSSMPEVAGDAALLIDPYSVESIAGAMRELLDDPRRTDSLRISGLERAKTFRWSYSADKLHNLCKSLTENVPINGQ